MKEFRPRLLFIVAVVLSLAMLASFGAAPGFSTVLSPGSGTASILPDAGDVNRVADKSKSKSRRESYVWSAARTDSNLRLRGSVPSEEDRRTVLGMVKAHLPDLQVEDRLKIARGEPPKEQWLGAVSFALQQLSHLKSGTVRLYNVGLRLDGEARSASDYDEMKKALESALPTGLTVRANNVRPPVADPFVFTAALTPTSLTLSGSVPSENARKRLKDISRRLFVRPTLDDKLQLASGVPTNWNEAVLAAMRALSRLDAGKVALSGIALTIEGIAPDKGTAVAISYQLRRDLPPLFSSSENITWKQADSSSGNSDIISRIKAIAQTGSLPKAEAGTSPLPDGE